MNANPISAALLGAALLAAAARAADPAPAAPAPAKADADMTVITSERLTFDYQKHFALFEENVVVTDPQLRILADRLTVLFDGSNKAQSVRAEGNVFLTQEDKKAKADLATYDVASGEIVLTGNPQVTRGQDVLTGDKITFWRNDNRMKVDRRAKLMLYPDGSSKSVLSGGLEELKK